MSSTARRGFFREVARHVARAAADVVPVPELPLQRRPPGAVAEAAFVARCDGCGACADACEPAAIFTLPGATPTPVMVPDQRSCTMCQGFPCASACPTGALVVPQLPIWPLGVVRIREDLCFTFRGPECGACSGLCPAGALGLRLRLGRPVVDAAACVGCGLCIEACPTSPKAIELLPVSPGTP